MTIEFRGVERFNSKMHAINTKVVEAMRTATSETALKTAADARKLAPSSRGSQADSGGALSLRQSIHAKDETVVGNTVQSRVIASAPHAAFVEFGTGAVGAATVGTAGIQAAKEGYSHSNKSGWVYPITIAGEKTFRFTRGMRARPFLYPAAKANEAEFRARVRRAVQNVLRAYE